MSAGPLWQIALRCPGAVKSVLALPLKLSVHDASVGKR